MFVLTALLVTYLNTQRNRAVDCAGRQRVPRQVLDEIVKKALSAAPIRKNRDYSS
jgi:hypothetical protein